MPIIRDEHHVRRASYQAAQSIDTTTYDLGCRFGTDGKIVLCGATEVPQFIAASSAENGETVSVLYLARGLRCALRVFGSISAGRKVTTNASAQLIQSATAESAALGSGDFGVALEDGTDGQFVEIDVIA